MVLIDYQNEMFEVIRSETEPDMVELNVLLLAKTAKAFDMPIVLSTVGVGFGFNGPTLPSVLAELEGIEPIDRSSMNAFEDQQRFAAPSRRSGRKRLHHRRAPHRNLPDVRDSAGAQEDGYDVLYVTDAVGGRSQVAHRTAIDRLAAAGAVPTTALAVVTELFRDWAGPLRCAGPGRHLLVLQRGGQAHGHVVGVADAELKAAAAPRGAVTWRAVLLRRSVSSPAAVAAWDALLR